MTKKVKIITGIIAVSILTIGTIITTSTILFLKSKKSKIINSSVIHAKTIPWISATNVISSTTINEHSYPMRDSFGFNDSKKFKLLNSKMYPYAWYCNDQDRVIPDSVFNASKYNTIHVSGNLELKYTTDPSKAPTIDAKFSFWNFLWLPLGYSGGWILTGWDALRLEIGILKRDSDYSNYITLCCVYTHDPSGKLIRYKSILNSLDLIFTYNSKI